jgi:malto-oligosyltrehalose trehalohydrolase
MSRRIPGARITTNGIAFSLWAPAARRVDVVIGGTAYPLEKSPDGWFAGEIAGFAAGTLYVFRIDDRIDVPDPASAFQASDVTGPSEVIAHTAYPWRATDWRGRPWEETVLVETHVGTFTEAGTYRAMIDHLDELVATGFTALELMPLADFPGRRNWGYDGVLWYAPDSIYGRPDDLKALIDEAHLRGLMVFLDVVYNHFGPEGNYIGVYAPEFFTDAQTPWGSAIDYERREVRDFAVENAVHWLRDYRFDGLRLDAVHAIVSKGEVPMLHELSRAVGNLAAETGRTIHLMLENDDNQATLLDPCQEPPAGQYRGQWNDDYHHAWHVLLTGEDKGYYSDYAPDPAKFLARALASGFAYQGEPSLHRDGILRGEPSGTLPPAAFVNFLQNHDQIGNRALGERLDALAQPEAVAAALQITLIAPTVPMLFMGEDWGATTPFPFFCDFEGDLAHAIRKGRRKEFASAYARYGDEVPDPLSEATFRSATLKWEERKTGAGMARLDLVKKLITLRRTEIGPRLRGAAFCEAASDPTGLLTARWTIGDGRVLSLAANLGTRLVRPPFQPGAVIWGEASLELTAWSVVWRLGATG